MDRKADRDGAGGRSWRRRSPPIRGRRATGRVAPADAALAGAGQRLPDRVAPEAPSGASGGRAQQVRSRAKVTSDRRHQQASFARVQEHATSFADLCRAAAGHRASSLERDDRITIRAGVAAKWKNGVHALSRADAVVPRQESAWYALRALVATS